MSSRTALPEGAAKVQSVDRMFDTIAPRYDLLNRLLTFGMDVGWRRRAVRALELPPGSTVLDVACGTGDLCEVLASAGHRPVGVDRSAGMLGVAAHRLDRAGAPPLVRGDGLDLPFAAGGADGVVCGFALRNFASLDPFFAECARVLRHGGRVALLEVATPAHPLLRAGHALYFGRVVPLVGGLVSDRAAYRYLPRSVAYLPPQPTLLAMLAAAGFSDVTRCALSVGIAQLITATRA